MYKLITIIWLLCCIAPGVKAQGDADFNRINNETYRLYLQQDWDSLIQVGKIALKQDIDYYYLRMRLGVACYKTKNFRKAADHFTTALTLNQDDPVALEYLYFSRILSGQKEQANLVRKQFKGDLALKLPAPKSTFIDRIGVEYLYNRGINDDEFSNPEELFSGLPPGVQYTTRHYSNASLSLTNSIAPGFSLLHTYTYLSKTNHHYSNDGTYQFYTADQHVHQHQYYISPRISTLSGFTIIPLFHLISGKYQVPLEVTQGSHGGSSQVLFGYLDYKDFIAGLGLKMGIGSFDLHLEGYYATLNNSEQIQSRLGITWYPLGNLNLYAGGYLNGQYEMTGGDGVTRSIPEFLFGFAISEKVWFNLNAAMGDMTNYLENNGTIVYNSFSDVIEKKVKLSLSIPVSDKGSLLYLGGRWTSNRSEFYPLDPADQGNITNTITYSALSIYGGISWKF